MSRTDSKPLPWEPIKDLPENWQELASPELRSLAAVWRENKDRLENSQSLKVFNQRLAREWAIETGIIENLYTLDRGTTETLIEHGIRADLIRDNDSDAPAEYVVNLVTDQQNVLEGIFDFVKGERELTTSYIKELHAAFTRHQPTTKAVDQFGNINKVTMLRGEWKKLPNNPSRPDGSVAHFYAPPEHTASEMDRLIEMHRKHIDLGVSPEVEAAWLHHRFAQIHPFQDGNGRVARTLASIVLIKAGLFPMVVSRDIRSSYINSLELADSKDVSELITLMANVQKQSILKAMAVDNSIDHVSKTIDEVLDSASERLLKNKLPPRAPYSPVFGDAYNLELIAKDKLKEVQIKLFRTLKAVDPRYSCDVEYIGTDDRTWSGTRAGVIGEKQGYVADTDTYRSIVRIVINERHDSELGIIFHSIGPTFVGTMGITSFLYSLTRHDIGNVAEQLIPLSPSPFVFTYLDDEFELEPRFRKWLDEVILFGLDEWRRQL